MSARDAVERGLYDAEECEWFGWTGATVAGGESAPDTAVCAGREAMAPSGHQASEII
jgi:3-oxoacyl-[acyl-carrier-protein] synthase-3